MAELLCGDVAIIVCILAGIVLMTIEAITPGLGLPGLAGAVMIGLGTFLMYRAHGVTAGLVTLLLGLLFAVGSIALSLRSASRGKLSKSKIILDGAQSAQPVDALSALVGLKGRTLTPLSPVGEAEIDGERREVLSDSGYIPSGESVVVLRTEGKKIVVVKA